jgi:hypothetical protein
MMNHDVAKNDRVPVPAENLHHPAKKPAEPVKRKDDQHESARDDGEHGGTERDTMTPGRPR